MRRPAPTPSSFRLNAGLCALLCCCMLLAGCGESPLAGVNRTLDARDAAISERDIAAYDAVIAEDYQANEQTREQIVSRMQDLFKQFSGLKMESFGRDVYIEDDDHAHVAQSYRLKVMMDGSWREMLQREELRLVRSEDGWKISSGL